MVDIIFDNNFKKQFSKIKDKSLKEKIKSQLSKIFQNPKVGKPMKNTRKGTRELYISPFRLSYYYHSNKNIIEILDLYHKKYQ